jgi:cell division protein FtsQ
MKRFWNILKKVLLILSGVAVVVLFMFVLTSSVQHQNQLVCNAVQVNIDYEKGISFLMDSDVKQKLDYLSGGALVGKVLSTVDFRTLEKEMEKNPFVESAEIYTDQQQVVHVNVVQKYPILRVINNDGVGYYISDKGKKIPMSDKFTAHVPVALGVVETHEDLYGDSIVLNQLFELTNFVRKDTLLNALVDQIYVHENGEFDIQPKFGYHTIVFGKVDEMMADKFDRLKIFYKEALTKFGWEKYNKVNLKFKNQVVCEKRESSANIDGDLITDAQKVKEDTTVNREQ